MNERIKEIRIKLGITQQEMADKLGLKRNTIATYEMGKANPSERTISDICREFGINELWLRTGEGGPDNMFTKVSEDDAYSLALGKLSIEENQFVRNAVKYLANADPEKLKVIEEFMKQCLGLYEKGE